MKVLFINPGWGSLVSTKGSRFNRPWPPLDLLNCAALLEKEGFEVQLLDARASPLHITHIAQEATKFDKCFITSSPIDRWQCPNIDLYPFLELVSLLPKKALYVMGVHGTVYPGEMLEQTKAMAIIRGEPEFTVLDIARGNSLKDIPGISFNENGSIIHNTDRAFLSLNDLPVPSFHLLDIRKYRYELLGNRLLLFEGSRGCPYPCVFCQKTLHGTQFRTKSPEKLADEIVYGVEKFQARSAYFIDLEFTLRRDFVVELCNRLIGKKVSFRWTCQTRADTVDFNLLKLMNRAGCKLIHFGVETGSERIMDVIGKNISRSQIAEGVLSSKKAGIDQACFFMFGFPTETDKDRLETIAFAKTLNPTYASFHKVTPYPGTPLFNQIFPGHKTHLFHGLHQTFTHHNSLNKTGNTSKTHFTFTTQYSPSTKEDTSNWGNNGFLPGLWFEDKKDHLNQTIRKALSGFYMRWHYLYVNMLFCNPFSFIRKLRLFYNYWKSLH